MKIHRGVALSPLWGAITLRAVAAMSRMTFGKRSANPFATSSVSGGGASWCAKSFRQLIANFNARASFTLMIPKHFASLTRTPALPSGGTGCLVSKKSHSSGVAPDRAIKNCLSTDSKALSSNATDMITATRSDLVSPSSSFRAESAKKSLYVLWLVVFVHGRSPFEVFAAGGRSCDVLESSAESRHQPAAP